MDMQNEYKKGTEFTEYTSKSEDLFNGISNGPHLMFIIIVPFLILPSN